MSLLKTKNTSSSDKIDKMKQGLVNPKSMTSFNLSIDSVLHRKFKMAAIKNEESMTDIITQAMRDYIRNCG